MREELLKLFEDKEFAKKVMHMKTKEEVVKALSDKGVTPTDKEISELGNLIKEIISKLETLPEDELMSVAGGVGKFEATLDLIGKGIGGWFGLQTEQVKAGSEAARARASVAQAKASETIAGTAAVSVLVVAAAAGIYAFRKEIKGLWYSDKDKK